MTSIWHWIRDTGLPVIELILGAVLIGRLVGWLNYVYQTALDRRAKAAIEAGRPTTDNLKQARTVAQAIAWTVGALSYLIIAVVVLRDLGIPLSSLVAPATLAGVALGFGAQQVVGDLLAGFFLFAERQFAIGDLVRLSVPGQTTGISGTVEELTLRITKLRNAQGELIVVPNSGLRQVTNLSKDWSRVVIDVPIPVEEDLQGAISAIQETADAMAKEDDWKELILGQPIIAGVETIEVGYVALRVIVRTLPGKQFDIGRELRLRIAVVLQQRSISTPGPRTPSSAGAQ
ncbi:MAG: mechanosensitive ion channel family protein [Acidimicrobiales bacterium]